MIASTSPSSASVNFSPAPENTLMPLSSNGLWDAEITTPAVKPLSGVRYATAGVGTTPGLVRSRPGPRRRGPARAQSTPPTRACRGPARNRTGTAGSSCRSARTSAAPSRRTVGESSGYSPALPRTPSVPNSRPNESRFPASGGSSLQSPGRKRHFCPLSLLTVPLRPRLTRVTVLTPHAACDGEARPSDPRPPTGGDVVSPICRALRAIVHRLGDRLRHEPLEPPLRRSRRSVYGGRVAA